MNEVTNALLEAVIGLVVAVGAAVLIPLLQRFLASKIGVNNTNLLLTLAQTAVNMVEQQLSTAPGSEKKGLAIAVLKGFADRNNLKVDEASMHAAIEAAVLQLKAAKAADPVAVVAAPVPQASQ